MKYNLMHKDVLVAEIEIDAKTSAISKVNKVYNAIHLPFGTTGINGIVDRASLNTWWQSRSIPETRKNIKELLDSLHFHSQQELALKGMALSLSDQYWVKPQGYDIFWKDINFFDNSFSEEIGNALIDGIHLHEDINLSSPESTSDGWLPKKWCITNGERMLIKGGSGPVYQEPYNEVIASKIMDIADIKHVDYNLRIINEKPYSACQDFVTKDTELVTAWNLMKCLKKDNKDSDFTHFIKCIEHLHIPNARQSIEQMIAIDFLIANEDRHWNNFGAIRDANTLKWIGIAPIYDSGTSLWNSVPTTLVNAVKVPGCKPFAKEHEIQIKYIGNEALKQIAKISNVKEVVHNVMENSLFIETTRCEAIANALQGRLNLVKELVTCKNINIPAYEKRNYDCIEQDEPEL